MSEQKLQARRKSLLSAIRQVLSPATPHFGRAQRVPRGWSQLPRGLRLENLEARQLLATDVSFHGIDTRLFQDLETLEIYDRRDIENPTDDLLLQAIEVDAIDEELRLSAKSIYVDGDLSIDGNSLTLQAPQIDLINTTIDTQSTGSQGDAGSVSLLATADSSLLGVSVSEVLSANRTSSVSLVGATLIGGDVRIESTGESSTSWGDVGGFADDIADAIVGQLETVDQIQLSYLSPISGQAKLRNASTSITLVDATIQSSGEVVIGARAETDASMNAIAVNGFDDQGFEILVAVGLGQASSSAEIDIVGSSIIDAEGDVSIKTDASTDASVVSRATGNSRASGNTVKTAFNLAMAFTEETSTIDITEGVQISSGGSVLIDARGEVVNDVKSTTSIFQDGTGGLSAAVGVDKAEVYAAVDGSITSTLAGSFGQNGVDSRQLFFQARDVDSEQDLITLGRVPANNPVRVGERLTFRADESQLGLAEGREYIVSWASEPVNVGSGRVQQQVRLAGGDALELDSAHVDSESVHSLSKLAIVDFDRDAVSSEAGTNDGLLTLADLPSQVDRVTYLGPDTEAAPDADVIPGLEQNAEYEVVRIGEQIKLRRPGELAFVNFSQPTHGQHAFHYEQIVHSFSPGQAVDSQSNTIELGSDHGFQTGDLVFYSTDDTRSTVQEIVDFAGSETESDSLGFIDLPDAPIRGLQDQMGYRVVVDPESSNLIRLVTSPLAALATQTVDLDSEGVLSSASYALQREIDKAQGILINASLEARNAADAGVALSDKQQPWPEIIAGATRGDADAFIGGGLGFVGELRSASNRNSVQPAKQSSKTETESDTAIEVAGSVAVAYFNHVVEARVGSNADLESAADLIVESTVTQATKLGAVSEANRQGTGDENRDKEFSAAIGVGVYQNDVQAVIENRAEVDATYATVADARLEYPLLMSTVGDALNPFDIRDYGFAAFSDVLDGSAGLSQLFNVKTRSVVGNIDNDKLSVGAAVVVTDYTNTVVARIGDTARVNQNLASSGATSVRVNSELEADLIEVGQIAAMNLDLKGFAEAWIDASIADPLDFASQLASPFGVKGDNAIGGVFVVTLAENTTIAEIGSGVELAYAFAVDVEAQSDFHNLSLFQTGSKSTDFGFSASVSASNLKSDTRASIGEGTPIQTRYLNVSADDVLDRISVAGAILLGKQTGIGASVGVNVVEQNVAAFIGRPKSEQEPSEAPDAITLNVDEASITASSSGDIYSLVMAGALQGIGSNASNGQGGTTTNANSRQTGPIALTVPVAVNEFTSNTDAYVDQQNVYVASFGNFDVVAEAANDLQANVIGASFALQTGAGNSGKVNLAGSGAVAINSVEQNVTSLLNNSELVTGGGTVTISFSAQDMSSVEANAGGFSAGFSSSSQNRAGLSFGVSVAINDVSGNIQADLENSQLVLQEDSTLAFLASSESQIDALSVAGGASARAGAGSAGGTFGGAGAGAQNKVSKRIGTNVNQSTLTSGYGLVSFEAIDGTQVSADAGGVSLSVIVGGQRKAAGGIGIGVAFNEIENEVTSLIQSSQIVQEQSQRSSADRFLVIASSNASVEALSVAASIGFAGGGGLSAALAGAGAGASNVIRNTTQALLSDSTLQTRRGKSYVQATDNSEINSVTVGASLAAAFSASDVGASGAIGLSIAQNEIDNDTLATVENTLARELFGGDLTILAKDNAAIESAAVAASVALAAGVRPSVAFSGGGAEAKNVIGGNTIAEARNSEFTRNRRDLNYLRILADSNSEITSNIFGAYGAAGGSLGAAGSAAIGAGVSRNYIGYDLDENRLGSKTKASLQDSATEVAVLELRSNSTQTITSDVGVASVAIAASGGPSLGAAGSGASAVNFIGRDVTSTIDNEPAADGESKVRVVGSARLQLDANDASIITANTRATSVALTVANAPTASLAVGVSLANNEIANLVQSSITNADATTNSTPEISATESATIDAKSQAVAVAASASTSVGLGVSGAGASAINRIMNSTEAFVRRSNVEAGNFSREAKIAAADTSRINAEIGTTAVGAGVGTTGIGIAVGVALAENSIGDPARDTGVNAFVEDSTMDLRGGALSIDALLDAHIDASVRSGAISAAVGSNAGSGAGAGSSAYNTLQQDVRAEVLNSSIENVIRGNTISVNAQDESTSNANVDAVAVSASAGAYAGSISIGVARATNEIRNTVTSTMQNSQVDTLDGNLSVTALSNGQADTKANAAGSAVSTGVGLSGGGADAKTTIGTATTASVWSSQFSIGGAVHVDASSTGKSDSRTLAASVAAAPIAIAAAGSLATSTVEPNVAAFVGDSDIAADDLLAINATAAPEADATAASFALSTGLAVGVSSANVVLAGDVVANLDASGKSVEAGALQIHANLIPTDPSRALAYGSTGGTLLGVNATVADTRNTIEVEAGIDDNTESQSAEPGSITVAGSTSIIADRATSQAADAFSLASGLVAVGVTKSTAVDGSRGHDSTVARIGSGVTLVTGALDVQADGNTENFANNLAGSGGAIAGAIALPTTRTYAGASAEVGQNANLTVGGHANIQTGHTSGFNSSLKAVSGGLLTGGGGKLFNEVAPDVTLSLASGATITAGSFSGQAINGIRKANLGSEGNVSATTGGAISGVGVDSTIELTLNTNIDLDTESSIVTTTGSVDLQAKNIIDATDRITVRSGGVAAGGNVDSTLRTLADNARITVGSEARIDSAESLHIAARGSGEVELQANSETYGAATVGSGTTLVELRPVNEVLLEPTSRLVSVGDLNLSAGTDTNFNRDIYNIASYNDTFAGSLIPIENVNASAILAQTNRIAIAAGSIVQSGGNIRMHAEQDGFNQLDTQAKAITWVSELSNSVNDLTGEGGVEAYGGGTTELSAVGTVHIAGTVETGIHRIKTLTIADVERDPNAPPIDEFNPDNPEHYIVTSESVGDVGFERKLVPALSSLDEAIEAATSQRDQFYNDVNLRNFYNAEIARMRQKQLEQGLAYRPVLRDANGNPMLDGNGDPILSEEMVREDQTALGLTIQPIHAQAGFIEIWADTLNKTNGAEFIAPSDATVEIINETPAFIEILGIEIPGTNGGVFLNGVDESATHGVSRSGEPVVQVSNEVNLNFDPDYSIDVYPWPSITIAESGDGISNPNGRAEITTYENGGGSININAPVRAREIIVEAGRNGTVEIDLGTDYSVGGEEHRRLQEGLNRNGTSAVVRTQASLNTYVNADPNVVLTGERIFVTAEYINVNDVIQSGQGSFNVEIGQAEVDEVEAYRYLDNERTIPRTGVYQLGSDDASDYESNNDLGIAFDYYRERFIVEELRVSGGYVDLTGKVTNTRNGEIRVFGDHAYIGIDNQTEYDIEINRLDNSQRGEGRVIIKDFARGSEDDPYTTIYRRVGDMIETNEEDTTTGISFDRDFVYEPKEDLRFGWTVIQDTSTVTTNTYASSSLWGAIDFLAPDPADRVSGPDTTTRGISADRSGPRYFQGGSSWPGLDGYQYRPATSTTSTRTYKRDLGESWSGWGPWSVKTVRWQVTTEQQRKTFHRHELAADRDIDIRFLGQANGQIDITSNGNVFIDGQLRNPTGETLIATGCRHGQAGCDSRTVGVYSSSEEGVLESDRIVVWSANEIGTTEQPLLMDAVEDAPFDFYSDHEDFVSVASGLSVRVAAGHSAGGIVGEVYEWRPQVFIRFVDLGSQDYAANPNWQLVQPAPYTSLKTYSGDITAEETRGELFVQFVSANESRLNTNPGKVTLRSAGSIIDTRAGIRGNSFDLTSRFGQIGTQDRPLRIDNLNARQSITDSFNAWAASHIFTSHSQDLVIDSIYAGGDVRMMFDPTSDFGTIIDGNLTNVTDSRAVEDVLGDAWAALRLTEGDARRQERLDALVVLRTREYHEYWDLRETQDDPAIYDEGHIIPIGADGREFFLQEGIDLGLTGAELDAYVVQRVDETSAQRTVRYHELHVDFGSIGDSRDEGYRYEPTGEEAAEIESTKVWTVEELESLRSRAFLDVTDTEFQIEDPNIEAHSVTIVNKHGVGRYQNGMTIPLFGENGEPTVLTLEERAAIEAAEQYDIVKLTQAPVSVSARLEGDKIFFTDALGNVDSDEDWADYGFQVGQRLFLEASRDTTDEGRFFIIGSIIGPTMELRIDSDSRDPGGRGPDLQMELVTNILLAPVANAEAEATHIRVLRREDIDFKLSGELSIDSERQIFVGSEADLRLRRAHTELDQRVQFKLDGAPGADSSSQFNGDLIASPTPSSTNRHIVGGRVVIESAAGRIGNASYPLRMETNGYVIARAKDEVGLDYLRTDGSTLPLRLNQVFSQTSFVDVTSSTSIQDYFRDEVTTIRGTDISLESQLGSVGGQNDPIEVDTADDGTLTAISGADIFVDEVTGDLTYRQVEADGGTVYLNAPQGSIWKLPSYLSTIFADKLWLSARDHIGHTNGSGYIDIDVNHFEAFTETGDIIVNSGFFTDHITLGGATHNTHGLQGYEDGVNAGGRFELYSREVTVAEPVSGATSVFFRLNSNPITVLPGVEIASDDWISFSSASTADIQGELNAPTARVTGDNNDNVLRVRPTAVTGELTITGAEGNDEIHGSDFADRIFGSGGDDFIFGYAGDDVIYGNDGVDRIDGGEGCDEIYGGNGIDEILNPDECDSYGTLTLLNYQPLRRTMTTESWVGRLVIYPIQEDELTYRLVDDADGMLRLEDDLLYVADPQKIRENEGQTVSFTVEVDHIEGGTTRETFEVDIDWHNIAEVDSLVLGDGTEQRSLIDQLQLTFLGPVDVAEDAFSVRHRGENTFVDTSFTLSTDARGNTVATIDFAGELTRGQGALTDGNYEFFIDPGKVIRSGDGGRYLDGDGDGRSGGVFQFGTDEADDFYAFFGDSNGDRFVTTPDFIAFRNSLGASPGDENFNRIFDFNSDGYITTPDFIEFRRRLGQRFQFD